jgi:hypothetical protein
MRNTLLFIAIFCSILFAANETRAQCACTAEYVDITARGEFKLADAVFVGKVVAITNTGPDQKGHYIQTVTFEVSRAWKHDVNSNLTITYRVDGCIIGFEKNQEWLVYAYKKQDGTFGIICCCSRSNLLAKADDDVKTFADDPPAKILGDKTSKP